jgi:hypothetical protein
MNALAFDTLAYARRLELAGFSRQQAEALAEEQAKLIDERLATKADIAAVRGDIEALRLATKADIAAVRGDIEALRLTTKSDLRETELRLESRIEATKAETLKWLVGSMGIQTVVIIGAVVALVRAAGH